MNPKITLEVLADIAKGDKGIDGLLKNIDQLQEKYQRLNDTADKEAQERRQAHEKEIELLRQKGEVELENIKSANRMKEQASKDETRRREKEEAERKKDDKAKLKRIEEEEAAEEKRVAAEEAAKEKAHQDELARKEREEAEREKAHQDNLKRIEEEKQARKKAAEQVAKDQGKQLINEKKLLASHERGRRGEDKRDNKKIKNHERIHKLILEEIDATDRLSEATYRIIEADNKRAIAARKANQIALAGLGLAVGIGLDQVGSAGIRQTVDFAKAGIDLEKYRMALAATLGSMEAAIAREAELRKIAELPGISFEVALKAEQRFRALGLTAEQSTKLIVGFSNSAANSGLSLEQLDEGLRQVAQELSRVTVEQDGLNSVTERFRSIVPTIHSEYGKSAKNINKTIKEQKETNLDFFLSIADINKQAAASADTAANEVSNLSNAYTLLSSSIGTALLPEIKFLVGALADLTNWFNRLDEGTQKLLALAFVGGTALTKISGLALSAGSSIALMNLSFGGSLVAIKAMLVPLAIASAKFIAVTAIVVGVGFAIWKLIDALTEHKRQMDAVTESVKEYNKEMKDASNIEEATAAIDAHTSRLRENRAELLKSLGVGSMEALDLLPEGHFTGQDLEKYQRLLEIRKELTREEEKRKRLVDNKEAIAEAYLASNIKKTKAALEEKRTAFEEAKKEQARLDELAKNDTTGKGIYAKRLLDQKEKTEELSDEIIQLEKDVANYNKQQNAAIKTTNEATESTKNLALELLNARDAYEKLRKASSDMVSGPQSELNVEKQIEALRAIAKIESDQAQAEFDKSKKTEEDKQKLAVSLKRIELNLNKGIDQVRDEGEKKEEDRLKKVDKLKKTISDQQVERDSKASDDYIANSKRVAQNAEEDARIVLQNVEDNLDKLIDSDTATNQERVQALNNYIKAAKSYDDARLNNYVWSAETAKDVTRQEQEYTRDQMKKTDTYWDRITKKRIAELLRIHNFVLSIQQSEADDAKENVEKTIDLYHIGNDAKMKSILSWEKEALDVSNNIYQKDLLMGMLGEQATFDKSEREKDIETQKQSYLDQLGQHGRDRDLKETQLYLKSLNEKSKADQAELDEKKSRMDDIDALNEDITAGSKKVTQAEQAALNARKAMFQSYFSYINQLNFESQEKFTSSIWQITLSVLKSIAIQKAAASAASGNWLEAIGWAGGAIALQGIDQRVQASSRRSESASGRYIRSAETFHSSQNDMMLKRSVAREIGGIQTERQIVQVQRQNGIDATRIVTQALRESGVSGDKEITLNLTIPVQVGDQEIDRLFEKHTIRTNMGYSIPSR